MAGRIEPLTETGIIADLLKSQRRNTSALTEIQIPQPAKDTFTVAATPATTYQLTAIPYQGTGGSSLNFSLNGVELLEGVDYTVDYTSGLVTVSATLTGTPTPADVLSADYWTTGDLIAATGVADTGILLADTFDRADSTSTINPASDGGTWTVDAATWGISSNQGYVATAAVSNGNWIRRDAGASHADMSVDVFVPVANTRLVWLDITGNGARIPSASWTGYEVALDGTTSSVAVQRIVLGAVSATIFSASITSFQGSTATLRFTNDGAGHLAMYQNGTLIGSGTDGGSVLTGTWVGLGTSELGGAGSIRFNNFSVS